MVRRKPAPGESRSEPVSRHWPLLLKRGRISAGPFVLREKEPLTGGESGASRSTQGRFNLTRVRIEYFGRQFAALEGFKGRRLHLPESENTSARVWATSLRIFLRSSGGQVVS